MTIAIGNDKFRDTILHFLVIATLLTAASLMTAKDAPAQDILDETFTLELDNVDIHSLIETVSTRTGKNFIIDPRVNAIVNVVSSQPVNATRLYEIFLSVLEVHGYAAVEAGQFIKIVPSSVGVQSAVPLVNEHTDSGAELVSRIIHLQNMPALQVIETLRPLLSEPASLTAQSTGNAIVITDHAANIEKLIELITLMDSR